MHSFDPEIAKKVGVNAAVIYQNLIWWTEKNAANGKHFYDGRHWTYNSVSAFGTLFPYLTAKQIRSALLTLEEEGFIVCGNYNVSAYDRTKWYSPCEQVDLPYKANGFDLEGKPIPDSKPDIKPDRDMSSADDHPSKSDNVENIVAAWNELAEERDLPKVAKITAARRKQIQARLKEYSDDEWSRALTAIYRSRFLCGDNDRGWKANFDFLLQPSSFAKLLEGAYDGKKA